MRRPSQAGRVWCGVLDLKTGEKGMQWGWGGSPGRLVKYTGGGLISYRCMLSIMGASNSVGEGSYKYWKGENWNESCEIKIGCINVNSWLKKILICIYRDITDVISVILHVISACVFICIHMCLRFFVHKEGWGCWGTAIPQRQWIHHRPRSWLLNTIFHYKKPQLLGQMADYRIRAEKFEMNLEYLVQRSLQGCCRYFRRTRIPVWRSSHWPNVE